ncbi:MAG TPA: GNAT family N-acetyltransferase [Eubacteriaceae bacterium]|nr:GNAT family N-acetyltransferase [Eubacteriaceae bacterium]
MDLLQAATKEHYEDMLNLRKEVFVEEQNIPLDQAFDGEEEKRIQVVAYLAGEIAGNGRLKIIDADTVKPERMCVKKKYRKKGIGESMVRELEKIASQKGYRFSIIHAQRQAADFYEKLGYQKVSDVFVEQGIEHVKMRKELSNG